MSSVEIIALSLDNEWAFVKHDNKILLFRPPYLSSNQMEVNEKVVDNALQLNIFKEYKHSFNSMREAIDFLQDQYIELAKKLGVNEPSQDDLKDFLNYASDEDLIDYLKRAKNEFIPKGSYDIAETIAIDMLGLMRENKDIKNMAIDILEEVLKVREDKKRIMQMVDEEMQMKWKARYSNTFGKFSSESVFKCAKKVHADRQIWQMEKEIDKAA
jgi:hypothetical protein